MKMQDIERILTLAIEEEEKAADLYHNLAAKVTETALRQTLLDFAAEEEQHKASLENVMAGDLAVFAMTDGDPPLFSEEGIEPKLSPDTMTVRQAMQFAITAEHRAFRLYMTLAKTTEDAGLKTIFNALAKQEATHGKRFEDLLDQTTVGN